MLALMAAPSPPPIASGHCAEGASTTLDVVVLARPDVPRHDQSIGDDRLVLRAKDGAELHTEDLHDGHWLCLGFDREKGRYLVGAYREQGAWLVLGAVEYLAEDGRGLEDSALTRAGYLVMASLTSPTGRYVAFVGGLAGIDGLFVLDTASDTVRRLGAPPAPPPLGDTGFTCDERFAWGSCWVGAYTTLEPDVMRFDGEHTLVVTRGADTAKHRAAKRQTRRYALGPAAHP